mgnify:CR=1 FL=1
MAAVSAKLRESIIRFFCVDTRDRGSYNGNEFFYNGKMDKFISIKSSVNNEIPVFCFDQSITYMVQENKEVIIPLTYNRRGNPKTYKTAHMLFNHLIKIPESGNKVTKVMSSNNETYYGSFGLLLDASRNPLMFATIRTEGITQMKLKEIILYVHPSIFTRGGILDKYIRDKVIPYILSEGIYLDIPIYSRSYTVDVGRNDSGLLTRVTPKIIISDSINRFFITTSEGDVDNASDIILNNLDDFLTYMKNE